MRKVHGWLRITNRFAALAVTCALSQLRTSNKRKVSFSATRQPCTVELALLLCLLFIYPTDQICKSKPRASLRRWLYRHTRATTEVAAPRCERSMKEPITASTSVAKDSCSSCGYATQNCAILAECSPPDAECSSADQNRSIISVQTFVELALSLCGPLSLSSLWTNNAFSETTITDKR